VSGLFILAFASALFSATLAFAAILRARRSLTNWFFFLGMLGLALESVFAGLSLRALSPETIIRWQSAAGLVRGFLPAIWLFFSLSYSRGNYREFLARWRFVLATVVLLPVILTAGFQQELFLSPQQTESGDGWVLVLTSAGKALNVLFLIGVVLALTNLEKTFRTTVGTMRWRIKFVVLGLGVIFGAKIYVCSQALLYSKVILSLMAIEPVALLLGCLLITISYFRSGRLEIDVYPSHTFLYSSITVLLTGVYLVIVGLLANLVIMFGGDTAFPIKAFFILIGVVGLAVMLLSDRMRQATQRFISRNFKRPLYDSRKVWSLFTGKTANATDQASLCAATTKLVSDTFNVLSTTIWLADETDNGLVFVASTSLPSDQTPNRIKTGADLESFLSVLRAKPHPFDLDESKEPWAVELQRNNPADFRNGGHRVCVPIVAGECALGIIILADRVRALPFSQEELDLLRCIGGHVAASLLTIQLSQKLMQAKEQEAFRAVSAFFAHDLKNSASTLSLMLQNLPLHFDDPEFRADVLRGISKTVSHMNHLISRLSVLGQKPELKSVAADLNEVVAGALGQWKSMPGIDLEKNLQPLPKIPLDPEQIQNVVTNLVLNARDAVGHQGRIRVQTSQQNGWAMLTVSDNGCGMSAEFLRQSLFRPFQTTKKDGTGIGMFQCKMIIEAHQGKIEVKSEMGKGSSFYVMLPLPKQP
jgi:putative PEP-CTERM system histidine kinase